MPKKKTRTNLLLDGFAVWTPGEIELLSQVTQQDIIDAQKFVDGMVIGKILNAVRIDDANTNYLVIS